MSNSPWFFYLYLLPHSPSFPITACLAQFSSSLPRKTLFQVVFCLLPSFALLPILAFYGSLPFKGSHNGSSVFLSDSSRGAQHHVQAKCSVIVKLSSPSIIMPLGCSKNPVESNCSSNQGRKGLDFLEKTSSTLHFLLFS